MPRVLTIVDLALHAASLCPHCRQGNRPMDDSDMDHGDSFVHETPGGKQVQCGASNFWALIRRLENEK